MKYTDEQRIEKILRYALKLQNYILENNITKEKLLIDENLQWTVTTPLYNIGEHTYNLSKEYKTIHSNIQWNEISGLRHRLVHGYDDINWNRISDTVFEDVPIFIKQLKEICKENGWEIPQNPPRNTYTTEDFDKTLARAELAFRRYQEAKNKGRAEGRAEMNLQLMAMQQERERERQEHKRECQKSERIYNILIDEPKNDCEKKFFALAKHAIKVNKNYTEHNEKLAIRDLFKAGFSHDEISDTLEKNSPLVRDKSEIEKNIQDVAEKNKINSKGSAR